MEMMRAYLDYPARLAFKNAGSRRWCLTSRRRIRSDISLNRFGTLSQHFLQNRFVYQDHVFVNGIDLFIPHTQVLIINRLNMIDVQLFSVFKANFGRVDRDLSVRQCCLNSFVLGQRLPQRGIDINPSRFALGSGAQFLADQIEVGQFLFQISVRRDKTTALG